MRRRALAALLALLLAAWAVPAGAALRYTSMEGVPWTYPVPLDVIRDEQDVLRLVNRDHLLDSTYPDQEQAMYALEEVGLRKATRGATLLRTVAAQALRELFAGAEAAGYKLYVDSAYRSYRTQEVMHYNRTQQRGYDSGSIQLAGASEHQTGLAADVVNWTYRDSLVEAFGETEEAVWMRENCARYGFILRYPKEAEDVTGVPYEPWHVRYVGVEAATYIMENGLTLEAFTAEWQAALAEYEAALAAYEAQGE